MRISDLSSDVCSSDLTQRMLGEVIRQLDVAREQVLVEAIIVEISDNAAKRLGVQFLLGGDPSSGVPFLATRSEEHTSELQSLMRISYAVFCLKKKIHIQTNITENIQP